MRNPSTAAAAAALASSGSAAAAGKAKVTPCCRKVGLKRGPWTPEEDEVLSSFILREGEGKWRTLPERAGLLRCGKSCRLRWMNYLRPSVKRGQIAADEEDLILRLHRLLGNRWSLIAGRLPGRTDNEIKNHWNTHLRKKLIGQGIDPRTHRPLNSPKPPATLVEGNNGFATPQPPQNPNPNFQVQNTWVSLGAQEHATSALSPPVHNDGFKYPDGSNFIDHYEGWSTSFGEAMLSDFPVGPVAGDGAQMISDVNCCTDNVFSSFLNSLAAEEVLKQNAEENTTAIYNAINGGVDLEAPLDPLLSESPAMGNSAFWETSFVFSPAFNEENFGVQSTYQVDEQL